MSETAAVASVGFERSQGGDWRVLALHLSDTEVTDLSPLAGHHKLAGLYVSGSALADLTPLASVGALKAFTASTTAIADVAPLSQLPFLELLSVRSSQVTGESSFSGFAALTELDLGGNPLGSLPNLADLKVLTYLNASNSTLSSVGLPTGSALRELFLYNTPLTDVSGLAAAGELRTLGLSGKPDAPLGLAGHIDALGSLSKLTYLDLGHVDGQALSFLADMTALQTLTLTQVDSIAGASLTEAPALIQLSLARCSVDSSAFLADIPVARLRFTKTNIIDLTPLLQNEAFTGSDHSLEFSDSIACSQQVENLKLLADREIRIEGDCDFEPWPMD